MFCRHNRLEANCPVCQREKAATRPAPTPRRAGAPARAGSSPRRGAGSRSSGRLVTKRLARAAEDGYSTELAMGVRAVADAERLATALALATARLAFPGPHPAVAEAADPEDAHWLAFLLAVAGPDEPQLQAALVSAAPAWAGAADDAAGAGDAAVGGDAAGAGDADDPDGFQARHATTLAAYRAWVDRHGPTQAAAVTGVAAWTPSKRFARTFDRLALPGFARAARFEFLTTLGAGGLQELEAGALHVAVANDDATTLGAKRALGSGDALLLERRAAELAAGTGVPIGALDRALALWDRPGALPEPDAELVEPIRAALGLT